METAQNSAESAIQAQILYIFNTLRLQNRVKSQKDFAALVGINEQTIGDALRGRPGYATQRTLGRIEGALERNGITINASDQAQVVNTGDNHGEQKFFSSDSALLIAEMAEQRKMYAAHIDRLLGIIENMQK